MKTKIIKQSLRSSELKQSLRLTGLKKPNKSLKKVADVKNLKKGGPDKEESNAGKLEIPLKKPFHRAAKFQDSEYISELDRDFGFDLNQDPLAEDL